MKIFPSSQQRRSFVHRVILSSLPILVALSTARPARAGGIYANEFGTPEMGTAGVGAEASALDPSTAIPFYNPAGMTRLKGNQLIIAGGALDPSVEFNLVSSTLSGGNGGQAAKPFPILTAAYVQSFTDNFKFGVALFGAAGAALEYDPTWAGRRQSQTSEILTLSLSPTLAYRVNDWFSFAAGVNIMSSALKSQVAGILPNAQITIDGTDSEVSYNASLMFEAGDKTRIGLSYVSETEFDYAGDVTLSGPVNANSQVNTTLTLAQVLRLGVHFDISDKAAIVGTIGWEDWSALQDQLITISSTPLTGTLPRNWEDTYRYGVGFHYNLSDPWRLRFGVNYDTSPTRASDRTADLPVDTQLRIAGGFQNVRSEKFRWGAELLYADLGDAEINNGGLVGDYSSNDYFGLAFNFQWRF